jgi:tetratricopeptide (TPR) repeat protein
VISIAGELERRQLDRAKAAAKHNRFAEVGIEASQRPKMLETLDFDASFAEARELEEPQRSETTAQLRSLHALHLCHQGEVEAGMAEWAELLAEVPDCVFVYTMRSVWLCEKDDAAALADCDRALALEPSHPRHYERRADCLYRLGDPERALANYRTAFGLDPQSFDLPVKIGHILRERGEHKEAAAMYGRAVAAGPRYIDGFLGRGQALQELGDLEGACRDFERVVHLDRTNVSAMVMAATCHLKCGRRAVSMKLLERVTELEPNQPVLSRMLGDYYSETNQPAAAVRQWSRVLEVEPEDHDLLCRRAAEHTKLRDHARALADYERALAISPGDDLYELGAHAARFAILVREGRHLPREEQLKRFDAFYATLPQDAAVLKYRGSRLAEAGMHDLAEIEFGRALALDPNDTNLHLRRAKERDRLRRSRRP